MSISDAAYGSPAPPGRRAPGPAGAGAGTTGRHGSCPARWVDGGSTADNVPRGFQRAPL